MQFQHSLPNILFCLEACHCTGINFLILPNLDLINSKVVLFSLKISFPFLSMYDLKYALSLKS